MQVFYNLVGVIVEQVFFFVWVVYLFVVEDCMVKEYLEVLDSIMKLGLKQGFVKGIVIGFVGICYVIVVFMVWYGIE